MNLYGSGFIPFVFLVCNRMRNPFIYILFLSATLFACSGNGYRYEDAIIECAYKSGVDIRKAVRKNEQFLIERGVLKDGSGQSYYDYCKSIAGSTPRDVAFDLLSGSSFSDSVYFNGNRECFDSLNIRHANRRIKALRASIEEGTGISRQASRLIKILTPGDLEHDYYKLEMCMTLSSAFRSDLDSGLSRQLPPMNEHGQPPVTDKRNMINVRVDANNQLTVNGTPTDIARIRPIIRNFFDIRQEGQEYPEKHIVNVPGLGAVRINKNATVALTNDRGTSYKFYIQVQNELAQAIRELRDELSMERFGKAFDNCSEEEQTAVAEVYPMAISEGPPSTKFP
jgi:biopolymer transport protein ExbD